QLSDEQIDQLKQKRIPGLQAVPYVRRYDPDRVAQHLIGYIAQNPKLSESIYPNQNTLQRSTAQQIIGISGIERTFERFLQSNAEHRELLYLDCLYELLVGLNKHFSRANDTFFTINLKLTRASQLRHREEHQLTKEDIQEGTIVI